MLNAMSVITRTVDEKIGWNRVGIATSIALIAASAIVLYQLLHDIDVGKMLGAVAGRFPRRMQRKSKEREPANAGQGIKRLRLRRHAAAERFAARDHRQA